MTAFDDANEALFADPNLAVDARWRVGGAGAGTVIRVIPTWPGAVTRIGGVDVVVDTARFLVRKASALKAGDTLEIPISAGQLYKVKGEPTLDEEGLNWRVEAPKV